MNHESMLSMQSQNFPIVFDSQDWMDDALCQQVDPDLWFPEKGGATQQAKSVCARCDNRPECLAYALKNKERHGIWGGLSERERRALSQEDAA